MSAFRPSNRSSRVAVRLLRRELVDVAGELPERLQDLVVGEHLRPGPHVEVHGMRHRHHRVVGQGDRQVVDPGQRPVLRQPDGNTAINPAMKPDPAATDPAINPAVAKTAGTKAAVGGRWAARPATPRGGRPATAADAAGTSGGTRRPSSAAPSPSPAPGAPPAPSRPSARPSSCR